VPATFVVVVLWQAMTGDDGIMNRHQHKQRLISLEHELLAMERSNQALEAEISALRSDPDALRRAAAEELQVALPGSAIYHFEFPAGLDTESAPRK